MKLNPSDIQKIRLTTLLSGGLLIVVLLLSIATSIVYLFPGTAVADRLGRLFPFPVARIGWNAFATTRELSQNMSSIRRFYESQDFEKVGMRIDFSTPEGKQRLKMREKDLFNKMIEDDAIRLLAREQGIVISPDVARRGMEDKLKELGTGITVEQNLGRLYGWTISDFSEKVVLPGLYEEELLKKFQTEDQGKVIAEQKIKEANEQLATGKNFATVAKEYSEGQTASEGGELGWFSIEDLAPDLQQPVQDAKRGVPTAVIESSLGFHILNLVESKLEDGKRLYHLQQIFTRKPSFTDWLTEKMRTMPISVYSREYRWNTESAQVEFRDQELIEFEKKLLEKAEGDPSLLL